MKKQCRLNWVSGYTEGAIGNSYGYRVHNDTLRKYAEKIIEITPDSKNFFMIMSPEYYTKKYDGLNFLFTMFEGTTLPAKYRQFIDKADYILTPSTWVKNLFSQYYDENKVFVVNHGCDFDFTFKKRKFPANKPFRYFWLGAPNPRKGWEEVINCWKMLFQDNPNVELYIKTTRVDGIQKQKNVILDGRNLSRPELIKLYHEAHCFLFPTRGEGFGLTLAEAMRTGLPSIATNYSGVTDFFDDRVGYPIGYKMGKGVVTFMGDNTSEETEIAFPFVDEMAQKMIHVYNNYDEALKRGAKAHKRISTKFTWPIAAQRLADIISTYGES